MKTDLLSRAGNHCELCRADGNLVASEVGPRADGTSATSILVCPVCAAQINGHDALNSTHWHCLSASAWSDVPAVQVTAYRLLTRLQQETWARDLLDNLYLDDAMLAWANSGLTMPSDDTGDIVLIHKDINGKPLSAGDTVTLVKDLKVKGASFTAKRGTAVRNISLVHDNASQIEGRVNDQQIVILTEFVKKA